MWSFLRPFRTFSAIPDRPSPSVSAPQASVLDSETRPSLAYSLITATTWRVFQSAPKHGYSVLVVDVTRNRERRHCRSACSRQLNGNSSAVDTAMIVLGSDRNEIDSIRQRPHKVPDTRPVKNDRGLFPVHHHCSSGFGLRNDLDDMSVLLNDFDIQSRRVQLNTAGGLAFLRCAAVDSLLWSTVANVITRKAPMAMQR